MMHSLCFLSWTYTVIQVLGQQPAWFVLAACSSASMGAVLALQVSAELAEARQAATSSRAAASGLQTALRQAQERHQEQLSRCASKCQLGLEPRMSMNARFATIFDPPPC